jgi:hypothetical protein
MGFALCERAELPDSNPSQNRERVGHPIPFSFRQIQRITSRVGHPAPQEMRIELSRKWNNPAQAKIGLERGTLGLI